MVRLLKQRPVVGTDTAASRLRRFLDRHPDARWRYSLSDLAREIGVSRQLMFMLLPGWTEERRRLHAARVRAFARTHRGARLSDPAKRLRWSEIADEVGLSVSTVTTLWSALRLPLQQRLDPEDVKRRRAEWERRYFATVLHEETCQECGVTFPWTVYLDKARRYYGRSVTCSRSCALRYYNRLRSRRR